MPLEIRYTKNLMNGIDEDLSVISAEVKDHLDFTLVCEDCLD